MKIKGKQLEDNTLTQDKINVSTDSIIDPNDVTTVEFVNDLITDSINELNYSSTNLNMNSKDTIINSGSQLACNTAILTEPKSNITVLINNVEVNIGGVELPYDGFFSPDGIIIRKAGTEEIGDYLYWNTDITKYQLESDDEIDFIYLVRG